MIICLTQNLNVANTPAGSFMNHAFLFSCIGILKHHIYIYPPLY